MRVDARIVSTRALTLWRMDLMAVVWPQSYVRWAFMLPACADPVARWEGW